MGSSIKEGVADREKRSGAPFILHLEKAAGGRFCSQESREKFFPQGNWMTIPSPYDMLEEE